MTEKEREIMEFEKKHDVVVTDRKTYELIKKIDLFVVVVLIISTIVDLIAMFK